ncbi:MAG: YIP1 family protein [Acidobacteriaceae bacterium]
MPEAVIQPDSSVQPLNEAQRIVDTFVAPSKTFTDILRNGSWWAPLVLLFIISTAFGFTVQKKIGWEAVYDNAINQTPKIKEMLANLPADRQAIARQQGIARQPYSAYGSPVITVIFTAIFTLLIWPTINFGFGGTAKFGKIFAVMMYTNLISTGARQLLAIVAILAGISPDSFNLQNPVGTNIGYYLAGGDAKLWLVTLGTFFDIFGIWALVATGIGCAIVGRVKRGNAMAAVFGWWVIFMLLTVGAVAAFAS